MSVTNGQAVDAANTNPAFLKPDVDDFTVSRLGMQRATSPSGKFVLDIQRYINNVATTIGLNTTANYSGEADSSGNTYGSLSSVVTNGDTFKTVITKLANTFSATTGNGGHAHTGAGNDGPQINLTTGVTGILPYANGGRGSGTFITGDVIFFDGVQFAGDSLYFHYDSVNHRLGLGYQSPATMLAISGDVSFGVFANALTGDITALDSNIKHEIRMTGSPNVRGIANGINGKELILMAAGGSIVLKNEDGTATAANRITTGNGGSDATIQDGGLALLSYDGTSSRWRVLAAGSGTSSPLTTKGDIYTFSTVNARLPVGTNGFVVTADSTQPTGLKYTSNVPASNYYSGYSSGASWSTTSGTFVDPTNSGTNALTQRVASGLTVTTAASNLPGVTFTPSSATAAYLITAIVNDLYNNTSGNDTFVLMTDGTTAIASGGFQVGSATTNGVPSTVTSVYEPGTASAVTVKLQMAVSAGTGTLQNASGITGARTIEWSIVQIKG